MNELIKILRIIILLILPAIAVGQVSLSGKVTDAESNLPLVTVTVYVPELKIAVNSNANGTYSIDRLHKGNLLIQFTRIGYETGFTTVNLKEGKNEFDIKMHPSQMELKEVKVIGTQSNSPKEIPYTVDVITISQLKENGAFSVSDAVAKLPGVSQLTTGVGISKPVIRGLYGNRVQVNVMGLRFDNQQWQDEHGLGLSDIGIDRIEIIKGPATLMYGSDAMGGVLNVIDEKPAPLNTLKQDVSLKLLSNTLGIGTDYGIKKTTEKCWWRVRAGLESNADYSSSGNTRVLNSRFADYSAKASIGFNRSKWSSINSAYFSFSQFGFVFDSTNRKTVDERISRTFDGPHHIVSFIVLSSENSFYKNKTKIKLNGGLVVNHRQEQEGGNQISLDMLLTTGSLLVQATTPIGLNGEWTNGISLMVQTNKNYGARTIIPDALTFEGAAFSFYKHHFNRLVLEAGLRYDNRQIDTYETGTINGPGSEIQPFSKNLNALNGSVGFAYNPFENLNIKGNFSTGYRSGNLAELSSNGLHEGTSRWEVGNPGLKAEQNTCSEIGFTYELKEQVEFSATGFYNRFLNYIYLAPTGQEYVGFNIYNYVQSNSTLKGSEVAIDYHPATAKWLDIKADYSYLEAKQDDGAYLPFIPANKINAEVRCESTKKDKSSTRFIKGGITYVFPQNNPAEFETATADYLLINAAVGSDFSFGDKKLTATLVCTNLADKKYYDHLSRFKYYGIYNIGRNISLNLHFTF
ncbi:MAG: TonB-dependent receptor [Bacteroidia bacterium]